MVFVLSLVIKRIARSISASDSGIPKTVSSLMVYIKKWLFSTLFYRTDFTVSRIKPGIGQRSPLNSTEDAYENCHVPDQSFNRGPARQYR